MTAANLNDALRNYLLASLSVEDFKQLESKLEPVSFKLGEMLYEAGDKMNYAYFPTTMIVSMLYVMENGATAEIGIIGNDGIVGNALFLGGETATSRAIIQCAGFAVRISARDLKLEFTKGGRFQNLLQRYTHSLMVQISQSAVCYRFHPIEERLARWLLMMHDRIKTAEFRLTHEFLSNMLGVRREGVTLAAGQLQQRNLISHSRGLIKNL